MTDPTSYAAAIEAAARVADRWAKLNEITINKWPVLHGHVIPEAIAKNIRALTPERGGGSEPVPPPPVPAQAGSGEVERREWRCFQCDEVLTTEDDALAHFGAKSYEPPACCDPRDIRELRLQLARADKHATDMFRLKEAAEAKCRELEGQLRIITDLHNRELARNCELDDPTLPARIRELEGEVARLELSERCSADLIASARGSMEEAEARADRLTLAAQAARDALEKQLAAMAEGFIICPRCGEQDTTSDLDFVGPLREALATLASALDEPRGRADRSEDITQTPSAGNTLAPKLSSEEITARGRVLADARSREAPAAVLDGGANA